MPCFRLTALKPKPVRNLPVGDLGRRADSASLRDDGRLPVVMSPQSTAVVPPVRLSQLVFFVTNPRSTNLNPAVLIRVSILCRVMTAQFFQQFDPHPKKIFVPDPAAECKPETMEDRRLREEDQARRAARHLRRVCQFQMVEMVVDDFCFDQVLIFCVTDGIMLKYMQTASDQEDAFSRAHSLLPTEQVRVALCMVAE